MKLTITTTNNTIYQFADKTSADDQKGIYHGRIENNIALTRTFSDAGASLTTVTIRLINHDRHIPNNINLWNAKAELVTDNGHKWSGRITSYRTDAGGKLVLMATERTAPELNRDLPDEFLRLVEVDENVHMSALNVTVPMVVGGTAAAPIQVRGILKNKAAGIYYLCVGEIREIVNVRVGNETLSRAEAAAKGYVCYTGAAGQAAEPGVAYVQITDPELRKNADGSYVEIGAEVVGLKLGAHSVEECRNGARFLLWLLKTAATGAGGWGLGVDEAEIDLASFDAAIAAVDAAGLKLDGMLYEQKVARNWITEICRAIRGNYEIGTDGKRRLYIEAPGASGFLYTEANMELVSAGLGAFDGRVYNKGRLDYFFNPFTGSFMQSANFSDSTSIAEIEEQEFIGESYLIRDAATAQKILDYSCKNSLVAAYSISFSTMVLPANCRVGTIVTVNHEMQGVSGLFRIIGLQVGDHINRVEAVRYDPAVFTSGAVSGVVNWTDDLPITAPVQPAAPSGLTLTQEPRQAADGTTVFTIKGTFTMPLDKYLGASVEWGEGMLPIYNWNSLGLLQGNRFEISGLKNDTAYAVRVRMVSTTGQSAFVTGTIMTESDKVPPPVPVVTAKAFMKSVSVLLSLPSYPADMRGYLVFRHTSNNSGSATQIGSVSAQGATQFADNVDSYGSYYYWAKSVDVWGNQSAFSPVASVTTENLISEDLSATALKMPTGAILSLSAKNCTTASIAEVGGVKDVSGNGNHGQAFGGVEVVDSEMGKVFSFDGVNDYILGNNIGFPGDVTLSAWIRPELMDSTARGILGNQVAGNRRGIGLFHRSGILYVEFGNGVNTYPIQIASPVATIVANEWQHVAVTLNITTKTFTLYYNGISIHSQSTTKEIDVATSLPFVMGRTLSNYNSYYFDGQIAHPKMFQRALSPSEIKTLYMFPDDVAFGQLTADLIGANIIKAENLIQTEAVISKKAQIDAAVFNQILVADTSYTSTNTAVANAQTAASNAQTAANTANTAATAAQTAATNAQTAISNITNDNKLTPDGKQATKLEWDAIVSEKPKNDTQATNFGVSKTAYGTAYTALSTYITPLLSNLTTTTDIVGTTFRTNFKNYYDARTDLLNAIAAKAKQLADTAQSTANTAKTAADNWAVAGTNYTQIKGGVITTGQIKSGGYQAPLAGEKFAQSGSSYDLDNATIRTENFYSDNSGAGIKGHVEADSGKIGRLSIGLDGSLNHFNIVDGDLPDSIPSFTFQQLNVLSETGRRHSSGVMYGDNISFTKQTYEINEPEVETFRSLLDERYFSLFHAKEDLLGAKRYIAVSIAEGITMYASDKNNEKPVGWSDNLKLKLIDHSLDTGQDQSTEIAINKITIKGNTTNSNDFDSENPRIEFSNPDGSRKAQFLYNAPDKTMNLVGDVDEVRLSIIKASRLDGDIYFGNPTTNRRLTGTNETGSINDFATEYYLTNTNAPGGAGLKEIFAPSYYAYINTVCYSGSGINRHQLALSYHANQPILAARHLYRGTWTSWREVLLSYGQNLSQNGYVKLSNGLIIQWGRSSTDPTVFPITFPVACFVCVAVTGPTLVGDVESQQVTSITNSSFRYQHKYWNRGRIYIAIGC